MYYLDLNFTMLVTTRSLDHHGIVSGTYDELEIGSVIDEVLPKLGQHKLTHSIVVKPEIGSYDPLISLVIDFQYQFYYFFLFHMTLLSLHIPGLHISGAL